MLSPPVADIRSCPPSSRQVDHRPGKVDGVDLTESPGEQHRMPPRSAAEVKRPPARRGQQALQPRGDQLVVAQVAQPVVGVSNPVERLRLLPAQQPGSPDAPSAGRSLATIGTRPFRSRVSLPPALEDHPEEL
jgi:hypothetical protein